MATIVVYGGGFQPFHEGHLSSYLQAKKALPDATFYVAASNDVKQRPIPFKDKQFLAQQAGVVDPFVETKNPINPQEILAQYDPAQDVYVMVRSERDPVPYTKKDGSPAYYQPYVKGQPMAPFGQHGYVIVTKKHNFTINGEEVYSGSQVRSMYGSADDASKMKMIKQLYPKSKQQQMIKKLLDKYLASPQEPAVMKPKTTAMSKLKNKALAEQINKIRPLIREASPAMKLKFMRLMKTAISESKINELSPQTLASYKKKAGADATASDKAGDFKRGDKRMSGIMKATRKEFDNDAKGVVEGGGAVMANTAKRLVNKDDGKVAKLRAAGDKRREEHLKGRDIAKRDTTSKNEWGVAEARSNPEQNRKAGSGKYELINYAEDNITDKDNWAVSMTMEPKLGINPQAAVSEDTPKGIYFYPLRYFMQLADRDESLPWGDNFPYLQLFQYDRSGEMTQQTQVDPNKLKQALRQYCSDEIIQQAIDEPEYDGTPYWFIYDCLSRLGKGDETNVVRWNKVLRDLGFTSVFDPGEGWIAYNEPTQGVVLDPRIIKNHKMFDNRNPTMQHRRYDIQGLADAIGWSSYYQRESQMQRVQINHPDTKKVMLDVAKSMLKPFLGKSSEEAKEMGYDKAIKAAADKVIEILKQEQPVTEAFDQPYKLKWEKSGTDITATTKLDDGGHLGIVFQKGYNQDKEEAWSVEFYRNDSQEVTGEGDAQRVFATVLTSIQSFIKKYKPNKVMFAANKVDDTGHDSQSRANLYDSLVQRYAKAWGFRAFRADTGNKVIYELSRIKPVAETLDDPWGDQGNFAGDKPVNIGGDIVKRLAVGDIVLYLGQKAKILAQSKPSGKFSRIEITKGMGTVTQDVLTSDLKRTGGSIEEGISLDALGKVANIIPSFAEKLVKASGQEAKETKQMLAILKLRMQGKATPEQVTWMNQQWKDLAKIALGVGMVGYATAAAAAHGGIAAAASHGAKDAVLHSLAEIGLEKAAEILASKFGINIVKNLAHGLATSTGQEHEHEQEHLPDQYGVSPAVAKRNQANLEKKFQQAKMGFGGMSESTGLSVEQLAHISDKALDDAYHYGRSTPGANFGWLANLQSAKAAKRLIDAGETDIEKISDAIHSGWNVTAAADYKGQLQLDTPTPDEKKLKRAKLAQQSYSQLPEEEKEKDRVVARAMLAALGKTNVSESVDYLEEK